jgi:sugar phosphate isomerase/epimerase
VTNVASPLFKVDWPGAPRSRFSQNNDSFQASFGFDQQLDVLERGIALAKRFKTNRVRCFDFWRLDEVKPYRAAMNAKLLEAAEICGKQDVLLILENEYACNTATGREAVETLASVPSPHFMLNWDPGNAVMAGELDAFPVAWDLLPKQRIGHCHCKNAIKGHDELTQWAPPEVGHVDWTAQFAALSAAGYGEAISLETHWRGAGTAEASTRISWKQMKHALHNAGTPQ